MEFFDVYLTVIPVAFFFGIVAALGHRKKAFDNMRYIFLLISSFLVGTMLAQDPVFSATVDRDTVLMDNTLKLSFVLENSRSQDFDIPKFTDFKVVGGPNVSSSFSIINGETTSSVAYALYLTPRRTGELVIPSATVHLEGHILETEPITVTVVDNPEGIKESFREDTNRLFDDSSELYQEKKIIKKKKKIYKL